MTNPTPGSDEAREQGCTCPVLDNCHGNGVYMYGETCYWKNTDCPIHGESAPPENKE